MPVHVGFLNVEPVISVLDEPMFTHQPTIRITNVLPFRHRSIRDVLPPIPHSIFGKSTQFSMCENLPQELIQDIMDYLRGDRKALYACSLVCRAWNHPARSRLFSEFDLQPDKVMLLVMGAPNIIPFIRKLRLVTPTWFWKKSFCFVSGFEAVQSLWISSLPWQYLTSAAQTTFIGQFSTVVSLHFLKIDTASFSQFAQLICTFRCLETLRIVGATWLNSDLPPSTLSPPPNLRAMELGNLEKKTFLQWLASFDRPPALHTLCSLANGPADIEAVVTFLGALGSHLKTLQIVQNGTSVLVPTQHYSLADAMYPAYGDELVSLRHNPSLRRLYLGVWHDGSSSSESIPQTLSQIVSTEMEEVYFRVILFKHAQPDPDRWRDIDAMLARLPFFFTLKRVAVEFQVKAGQDPRPWVIPYMPQCHARGILRVHTGVWTSAFER